MLIIRDRILDRIRLPDLRCTTRVHILANVFRPTDLEHGRRDADTAAPGTFRARKGCRSNNPIGGGMGDGDAGANVNAEEFVEDFVDVDFKVYANGDGNTDCVGVGV